MGNNRIKMSSVIGFFLLLFVFFGIQLGTKDRLFSQTENRLLAGKPSMSVETIFDGSFSTDYEEYVTDQFPFRDWWIAIKTRLDILLGRQEVGGVYLAQDGSLVEQHLPEDYDTSLEQKRLDLLEKLQSYVVEENLAGSFQVMLAPTADNVLTEKLPNNAPYYEELPFLEQVASLVGEDSFVSLYDLLLAHKEEYIYYNTDHHWTTLGAYYGYLAWAEQMGVTPVSFNEEERIQVSDDFLGTLHSKVNLSVKPDSILAYVAPSIRTYKVFYDMGTQEYTGLYEEKHLSTKNKYGYFLDDNHGLVEIETNAGTGKHLIMMKDSYANCMVPFLAEHYDKITILDLRYYMGGLFGALDTYSTGENTDVLILYNVIHFLENFLYYE